MSTTYNQSVANNNDVKTHALVAYILMTIGLFTAIPILIGAIWAMVKKGSAFGTVYYTHYINATRTFWWALLWTILGYVLTPVLIGFAILGATWLWTLYRLINGMVKIASDEPYPLY